MNTPENAPELFTAVENVSNSLENCQRMHVRMIVLDISSCLCCFRDADRCRTACLTRTPRKGLHLEKSVDQRKTFGTNRARHGATPEFTLPKTWEPPATGKPGAISHFCLQQPVNMM